MYLHAAGPPELRCVFGPVLQVQAASLLNAWGHLPILLHTAPNPLLQHYVPATCTGDMHCHKSSVLQACVFIPSP